MGSFSYFRNQIYLWMGGPQQNPHLFSSFCFAHFHLMFLITCPSQEAESLAQENPSVIHGGWWTRWLQTCNHRIKTPLSSPVIKAALCEAWCHSRSSCCCSGQIWGNKKKKEANSKMRTPNAERMTRRNLFCITDKMRKDNEKNIIKAKDKKRLFPFICTDIFYTNLP